MLFKILRSRKVTFVIILFSYLYFFTVGIFILFLLKKRFRVNKIIIGHYHIPLKFFFVEVLEAYLFNKKIHNIKNYLIITDVHLGAAYYSDEELQELENFLEKNNVIILGDLFEKRLRRKMKKKEIEIFCKALKKKNIIYIKGNHDPKIKGQIWFFKIDDILLTHGHITFFPLYFPDLIEILTLKKEV